MKLKLDLSLQPSGAVKASSLTRLSGNVKSDPFKVLSLKVLVYICVYLESIRYQDALVFRLGTVFLKGAEASSPKMGTRPCRVGLKGTSSWHSLVTIPNS